MIFCMAIYITLVVLVSIQFYLNIISLGNMYVLFSGCCICQYSSCTFCPCAHFICAHIFAFQVTTLSYSILLKTLQASSMHQHFAYMSTRLCLPTRTSASQPHAMICSWIHPPSLNSHTNWAPELKSIGIVPLLLHLLEKLQCLFMLMSLDISCKRTSIPYRCSHAMAGSCAMNHELQLKLSILTLILALLVFTIWRRTVFIIFLLTLCYYYAMQPAQHLAVGLAVGPKPFFSGFCWQFLCAIPWFVAEILHNQFVKILIWWTMACILKMGVP